MSNRTCIRGKKGFMRSKKPKFHGNQHTSNRPDSSTASTSASGRKLSRSRDRTDAAEPGPSKYNFNGYRLIDINLLFESLTNFLRCARCSGKFRIYEEQVRGLGSNFKFVCYTCNDIGSRTSCKMIGKKRNLYEINRRSALAMRMIGLGQAGLRTFCSIMDLPTPVQQPTYDKIAHQMLLACKSVAEDSMSAAVTEELDHSRNVDDSTVSSDITVSGDGTWRKRGYSSLHGVCTIIGAESGKVIDLEVLSSYCQACQRWNDKKHTDEFRKWQKEHELLCGANHTGSAGKMEVDGMLRIFQRSCETKGVRYTGYIGDGDTKTFTTVKKACPYGKTEIQMIECTGHVQKRMGTRLRKLKKDFSGKTLSDGKSLGGRGRLTDAAINQITSFYGNAIREHKESVDDMSRAIWAVWFHRSSTDTNPQHQLCPQGQKSWCRWQRNVATQTPNISVHKNSLPTPIIAAIRPIFVDLTKQDLLERCVGGYPEKYEKKEA